MKSAVRTLIGLCVPVILSACATGASLDESVDIEAVPPGMSRIVVYRTEVAGTAVQPTVSVDGRETGRCRPEGAFLIDLPPGEHRLSASTETTASTTVTTREGEVVYVECSLSLGVLVGHPKLTPVRAETGRAEARDLALTGRF